MEAIGIVSNVNKRFLSLQVKLPKLMATDKNVLMFNLKSYHERY